MFFPPFRALTFHFLDSVLEAKKFLVLIKVQFIYPVCYSLCESNF